MNGTESTPVPEKIGIPTFLSWASDADLVVAVQARPLRSPAYEELMVNRYGATLRVWAENLARGGVEGCDIENEVHFLMIDRKLAAYNPERGVFPAFLFVVVRSVSASLLRFRFPLTGIDPPEPVGADETALAVAVREADRVLGELVGLLRRDVRAVLERFLRGRSRAEIIADLGCTDGQYDRALRCGRVILLRQLPALCADLPPQTKGRPKKSGPAGRKTTRRPKKNAPAARKARGGAASGNGTGGDR